MKYREGKAVIKLNGSAVALSLYLLNALSLKYFNVPYVEAKRDANKKVREVVTNKSSTQPKVIEEFIFFDLLDEKTKRKVVQSGFSPE